MEFAQPMSPKPSIFSNPRTRRAVHVSCGPALVVMAAIVSWQNWGEVETPILFMTVSMPRSLFILSTLATGFLLGLLTPASWRRTGSTYQPCGKAPT